MRSLLKKATALLVLMALVAVVTAPQVAAAPTAASIGAVSATAAVGTQAGGQTEWACILCAVGAGVVISGGLGAVLVFLSSPEGQMIAVACAGACGLA